MQQIVIKSTKGNAVTTSLLVAEKFRKVAENIEKGIKFTEKSRLGILFGKMETIEGYLEKEVAMCRALQSNEDIEGRALYQGYVFAYEDILSRIKNIDEVNLDEEDM